MKLSKLSKILGLTTAFAISSQATLLVQQNKALASAGTSTLYPGEELFANQYLISPNRKYKAIQQYDGNFVLYDNSKNPPSPVWASNILNRYVYYIIMKTNCNLGNYTYSGIPVWATNTNGRASYCRLELQDNGNLVIYTSDNIPIWSTRTNR
ncbi:hypothetical protein [Nostoc sp.]|uniref:hypothetical protein n=1 Tax=Nostoc sp. TaxID=1180 RepID=UPI002FF61C6E